MKRSIKLMLTAIAFSIAVSAQNVKEGVQNTKQILEGKQDLERDIGELQALMTSLDLFKSAYESKDLNKVNTLKKSIENDMVREVRQSGEKAKKARMEIAQSSSEIRSDRREIRNNRDDSKREIYDRHDDKRDMARDQANKSDDKRDRRDDIADFEQQIARAEKQASILKSIKGLNFSSSDAEASLTNKKLLVEFIETMKQDIAATKKELAEDNRELREDSRERRDDRNERHEIEIRRPRFS
ncbi:hypothetical protein VOI54_07135 [Tamlana sp. 2201CG12-4]|uniref:hypothetical protein n=1 Tax=Tamlana sp. 2201CG12-4 TaxID=3112582 RepID=UPI002DBFACB5|nr:hypothetical protein [Tamlana sp. 2201CG12-4]MEC3906787.1 hypothetical protein [Tamlana sp. 2201CG12-4]